MDDLERVDGMANVRRIGSAMFQKMLAGEPTATRIGASDDGTGLTDAFGSCWTDVPPMEIVNTEAMEHPISPKENEVG